MSRRDVIDFVLLSAIFGASFLILRVGVPEFGPFALIGLRSWIAVLCLLPLMLLREGKTQMLSHVRELTVVGIVNAVIPFTLLAYAATSLTAGFTALINATAPLWAAVVGPFWLNAKLSRLHRAGLALGIIGMVVLAWGKVDFKPGGSGLAIVAGLIATRAYGFSTHYTKKSARRCHRWGRPLAVRRRARSLCCRSPLPFGRKRCRGLRRGLRQFCSPCSRPLWR